MTADLEKPIRVGIVGCGAIARIAHLKALAALPQYEILYLCDRDLAVARNAKAIFGLRANVTGDVRDLAGKVDAAIVCVWPRLHKPITLDLLAMGIDVLCEKPIAASSSDAAAMAAAAQEAGRILAIGHWCRFLKNMWVLRKLLDLAFLGDIKEVAAEFGGALDWPMSTGAYYDLALTSGGAMFDAGIHVLDLASWLFGEISNIKYEDDAYGGTEANGVLTGTVRLQGRNVPCRVAASWTHSLANSVRVVGTEGQAEAQLNHQASLRVTRSVGGQPMRLLVPSDDMTFPFRSSVPQIGLLEDFAQCIRSRWRPVAPADEAVLPLRMLETAYSVRQRMTQSWVEAGAGNACLTTAS